MSEYDFERSEFLHVDVPSPAKENQVYKPKIIWYSSLAATNIKTKERRLPEWQIRVTNGKSQSPKK